MEGRIRLTDGQVAVLEWVRQGCPPDRFDGNAHRVSARALQRRGLVEITGRGPRWTARITAARVRYLDAPPTDASAPKPPAQAEARSRELKTDRLVAEIVTAGGVLRVPRREKGGAGLRQRAYAAQAAGRLPEGMALTTLTVGDEIELRLVPDTRGPRERVPVPQAEPVPVPDKVDKLDPVAARFRRRTERHEVSRGMLERATRLVHAICREARRRKWRVAAPEGVTRYGRQEWQPSRDRHIVITAKDLEFRIRVKEDGVLVKGRLEEDQKRAADYARYGWTTSRPVPDGAYDDRATGRLELHLDGGRPFGDRRRRSTWRDHTGRSVEDTLGEVFAEISARVREDALAVEKAREEAKRRAEEAARAAEERARRWREHLDEARRRYAEARRAADLEKKLDRWQTARTLRELILECEQIHGEHPDTKEWLEWAGAYLQRIDPLASPPRLPTLPEPSPEDLRPYMPPGWSPYHP
jgi:hypothetical protein